MQNYSVIYLMFRYLIKSCSFTSFSVKINEFHCSWRNSQSIALSDVTPVHYWFYFFTKDTLRDVECIICGDGLTDTHVWWVLALLPLWLSATALRLGISHSGDWTTFYLKHAVKVPCKFHFLGFYWWMI